MLIPDSDRSMLPRGEPPVEFNPYLSIQEHLEEGRMLVEREVARLEEIRAIRNRQRGTRDD